MLTHGSSGLLPDPSRLDAGESTLGFRERRRYYHLGDVAVISYKVFGRDR